NGGENSACCCQYGDLSTDTDRWFHRAASSMTNQSSAFPQVSVISECRRGGSAGVVGGCRNGWPRGAGGGGCLCGGPQTFLFGQLNRPSQCHAPPIKNGLPTH